MGLRPIHHHKPIRAEGHLSVTFIAHQPVQVIRTRLGAAGQREGWAALRRTLEGRQRVTAAFRRDDGRTLVRKATRPEAPQTAIHDALGIDHAPGRTRRAVVRTGPKRINVVPLDDPGRRMTLMCNSILK